MTPNQWRFVAGLKNSNAPLEIKSNILVYDIETGNNLTVNLPNPFFKDTVYFVYVFEGEVNINKTVLTQGDSIITDDKNCSIESNSQSTIVCFIIDKEATYTRNGMYSGMKK